MVKIRLICKIADKTMINGATCKARLRIINVFAHLVSKNSQHPCVDGCFQQRLLLCGHAWRRLLHVWYRDVVTFWIVRGPTFKDPFPGEGPKVLFTFIWPKQLWGPGPPELFRWLHPYIGSSSALQCAHPSLPRSLRLVAILAIVRKTS